MARGYPLYGMAVETGIIIIIIIYGHKKKLLVQLEIHQAALNRFTHKLP